MNEIEGCRICGDRNLRVIMDLGDQCLGSRFPDVGEEDPLRSPLILVKCCGDCELLQLKHTVSGRELYLNNYGYRSGLNKTMTDHLHQLTKEISERVEICEGDIILDIGSNDCTLLKSYGEDQFMRLERIGIDPTGSQFKSFYPENIRLVEDFFKKELFEREYGDRKAKVVTSISMFYDLPDPIKFARDIKDILHEEGMWITEQSYCLEMLKKNSFDTICHEHLEYYNLKQLKYIGEAVGLKIIEVGLNECNGGSFRVKFVHEKSMLGKMPCKIAEGVEEREKAYDENWESALESFVERCEKNRKELKEFIDRELKDGKTISLYGASTKGNTLLQYYGIDGNMVMNAAERNPEKYGKRTPATNIPIISEEEMRKMKPNYLLVLPWHFKEEFVKREEEFLKEGGKIIFPLPEMEVCEYKKKH